MRQEGEGSRLVDAINQAIDECIAEGILTDILTRDRAEVLDMVLTEFGRELNAQGLGKKNANEMQEH